MNTDNLDDTVSLAPIFKRSTIIAKLVSTDELTYTYEFYSIRHLLINIGALFAVLYAFIWLWLPFIGICFLIKLASAIKSENVKIYRNKMTTQILYYLNETDKFKSGILFSDIEVDKDIKPWTEIDTVRY